CRPSGTHTSFHPTHRLRGGLTNAPSFGAPLHRGHEFRRARDQNLQFLDLRFLDLQYQRLQFLPAVLVSFRAYAYRPTTTCEQWLDESRRSADGRMGGLERIVQSPADVEL